MWPAYPLLSLSAPADKVFFKTAANFRPHRQYSVDMLFEIRQAVRTVRSHPSFALMCVVTLGLGIGTSAAVFSVVNGVLLQPLRFTQPERIIYLPAPTGKS